MNTAVITGATGVIGAALLDELADYELVCLAHERPGDHPRATWVHGDVTRPRFGLTSRAYRELARRADVVVHCAAMTGFSASPDTMWRLNVSGADAMLAFAAQADAPLYHLSTAFVARHALTSDDDSGPGLYIASKRAAEARVQASGLPAAVIRPSVLIGNSVTGKIARFQGLHSFVGAVLRNALPILPMQGSACIDFLPQDVVAAGIAALIRRHEASGEWWLTAGGEAPTVGRLLDVCTNVARQLGRALIPPRVVAPDVVDRLVRPVFIDSLPSAAQAQFDTMLEMTALFSAEEPFPSSLAQLSVEVGSRELERALVRSMLHWANCKGLSGTRHTIDEPVRLAGSRVHRARGRKPRPRPVLGLEAP